MSREIERLQLWINNATKETVRIESAHASYLAVRMIYDADGVRRKGYPITHVTTPVFRRDYTYVGGP